MGNQYDYRFTFPKAVRIHTNYFFFLLVLYYIYFIQQEQKLNESGRCKDEQTERKE